MVFKVDIFCAALNTTGETNVHESMRIVFGFKYFCGACVYHKVSTTNDHWNYETKSDFYYSWISGNKIIFQF